MNIKKQELVCLNCSTPESETPLLHLRYNGEEHWICSQCLPTLFHAPQKLAGKIANAEHIKPAAQHPH